MKATVNAVKAIKAVNFQEFLAKDKIQNSAEQSQQTLG